MDQSMKRHTMSKFNFILQKYNLIIFRPFEKWLDRDSHRCRRLDHNIGRSVDDLTPPNIAKYMMNMKLNEICEKKEDVLLIDAPTGSGKSVSVFLYCSLLC